MMKSFGGHAHVPLHIWYSEESFEMCIVYINEYKIRRRDSFNRNHSKISTEVEFNASFISQQ